MRNLQVIANDRNGATLHGYCIHTKVFTNSVSSRTDLLNKRPEEIIWHINYANCAHALELAEAAAATGVRNTLYIASPVATKDVTRLISHFDSLRFQLDTLSEKIANLLGYHDGYTDFVIHNVKQYPHTSITTFVSHENLFSFAEITDLIRNYEVRNWDIVNVPALADVGIINDTPQTNRSEIDHYVSRVISAPEELLPESVSVKYHNLINSELLNRVFLLGN